MKKVSVIIPIYESEKYIRNCIESVLNQTYQNLEIILVNDGSPDRSSDICDEYALKDNRIKIIHKNNSGVSSARNTGIIEATGEYIHFIDSDDYVEKELIDALIAVMNTKNIDLVISGLVMETNYNDNIINKLDYKPIDDDYSVKRLFEVINVEIPLICFSGPCCKLYKRKIIIENNILFDEEMSLGEDTLFNLKYVENCGTITTINSAYYHYIRQNNNSLWSKYNPQIFNIQKKVMSYWLDLMESNNCCSEAVHRFQSRYIQRIYGCISHYFKHNKINSKSDRKEIIKKVINDSLMNKYLFIKKPKNIKDHIIIALVRLKLFKIIIYLIYSIRYKCLLKK